MFFLADMFCCVGVPWKLVKYLLPRIKEDHYSLGEGLGIGRVEEKNQQVTPRDLWASSHNDLGRSLCRYDGCHIIAAVQERVVTKIQAKNFNLTIKTAVTRIGE